MKASQKPSQTDNDGYDPKKIYVSEHGGALSSSPLNKSILGLYIGVIYWGYILGLYIEIIYWGYILGLYIGVIYWDYILGLYIGVIYWGYGATVRLIFRYLEGKDGICHTAACEVGSIRTSRTFAKAYKFTAIAMLPIHLVQNRPMTNCMAHFVGLGFLMISVAMLP